MHRPLPLTRELVLVGGGHTHALVLRRWGMAPVRGVRLTLINPGPTAPYTGMLPGYVAGHYARAELDIDLVRLARHAGARLILDWAVGLDRTRRLVRLQARPEVAYDTVSFDVGITSDMPALPGFEAHGIAAKPLQRFADAWEAETGGAGPLPAAVIGGGIAGVELALAMAHRMRTLGREARIAVIERARILDGVPAGGKRRIGRAMADYGIAVHEGVEAARIEAGAVVLTDGSRIPSRFTVGAAGARPHGFMAELGLPVTDGYLDVDASLRSPADPRVYAAGDCAHLLGRRLPKAGVFAVREAPVLHHNLRADMVGEARRAFRPQTDYLKLVSLGAQDAVAIKWGLAPSGALLWTWKDRIDRAFMDRFTELAPMAPPPIRGAVAKGVRAAQGERPPCAACGAKVGRLALSEGMRGLGGEAGKGSRQGHLTGGTGDRDAGATAEEDPTATPGRGEAAAASGDVADRAGMGGPPRAMPQPAQGIGRTAASPMPVGRADTRAEVAQTDRASAAEGASARVVDDGAAPEEQGFGAGPAGDGPGGAAAALGGPGDDAAVIGAGPCARVITTDHLRGFTEDPWLLARVAAVHAMGDVWAMGARPEAALATLILPPMTAQMQADWVREAMAGAASAFGPEGARIVGGHTTVGAEATIGFAVTGVPGSAPVGMAGARPGDALILTKPVGAGILLAAEMRLAAHGAWIASLWDHLTRSQAPAAAVLSVAHAMTDVTGFGLLGHLLELCRASAVGARIVPSAVPRLAGADALSARGVGSTLLPENRAATAPNVTGDYDDVLLDPQTSGGLLAAVPDGAAALAALHARGVAAALIGRVVEGAPQIACVAAMEDVAGT